MSISSGLSFSLFQFPLNNVKTSGQAALVGNPHPKFRSLNDGRVREKFKSYSVNVSYLCVSVIRLCNNNNKGLNNRCV